MPADAFARQFLHAINVSGFLSIAFLIYTFVRSYIAPKNVTDEEFAMANDLLKSSGNSSLDYFKTYSDKLIFFSETNLAFIAYRVSGSFAVALENPVAVNFQEMKNCIREFDKYCYENGLKSIFYRVPEETLDVYHFLNI